MSNGTFKSALIDNEIEPEPLKLLPKEFKFYVFNYNKAENKTEGYWNPFQRTLAKINGMTTNKVMQDDGLC